MILYLIGAMVVIAIIRHNAPNKFPWLLEVNIVLAIITCLYILATRIGLLR